MPGRIALEARNPAWICVSIRATRPSAVAIQSVPSCSSPTYTASSSTACGIGCSSKVPPTKRRNPSGATAQKPPRWLHAMMP